MSKEINNANVHPLVLLSIVDHYNRVNGGLSNRKRVAGAILGNYVIIQDKFPIDQFKLVTAMQFLSKRILTSPTFGSSIICITKQCLICSKRSIQKKSLLDGMSQEIQSDHKI
mgnify:CR=1 FL=1